MINKKSTRAQEHRSISNLCAYALTTCALLLAGCAKQQKYEVTEQIRLDNIEKLHAMQIAEDVLAKMHFTIEKSDAETGFIRTRPLPGAQFFEFWRSDNVGPFNSSEANLHSIRRIAELNISQDGEKLYIDCNVKTQRLNLPERQITSSARAYEMFSESSPTMQKLRLNKQQKIDGAWVDLGQDKQLATEILKQIEKRMATPASYHKPNTSHESRETRDEK